MNQVTNLIQWKNLTEEQKSEFDFENYKYSYQKEHYSMEWAVVSECPIHKNYAACGATVYRLVVEPDKWYDNGWNVILGKDIINPESYKVLRPAKPHEIPKQEKTLEEKIQEKWPDKEVVMLHYDKYDNMLQFICAGNEFSSVVAQSIKGFYKYIYEHNHGDGNTELIATRKPTKGWKGKTIQPVAGLFYEESGE